MNGCILHCLWYFYIGLQRTVLTLQGFRRLIPGASTEYRMDTAGNVAIHHNTHKPDNAIPLMSRKKRSGGREFRKFCPRTAQGTDS